MTRTMGTSAYDLDRLAALPELAPEYIPEEPRRQGRPYRAEAPPDRRRRPVSKREAKRAARFRMPVFGILGTLLVGALLVMIVLSHMELAMISSEIGQLDREMSSLRAEAIHLQAAHEAAFGYEALRFAREELGMVEAARGQIVFIGSNSGDMAEVLHVPHTVSAQETGLFTHLVGLLREHLPFLS